MIYSFPIFVPALIHYLFGINSICVVCSNFLRSDRRVLKWKIIYGVRIHYIFLNDLWRTIYCTMHSLILWKLGSVTFISQLTQTAGSSSILSLVQGIQSILTLECIPCKWSYSCVVELGSVELILVAIVISTAECVYRRSTSFVCVANKVLQLVALVICDVNCLIYLLLYKLFLALTFVHHRVRSHHTSSTNLLNCTRVAVSFVVLTVSYCRRRNHIGIWWLRMSIGGNCVQVLVSLVCILHCT